MLLKQIQSDRRWANSWGQVTGTDYNLDSEIYSYSRARGLFAGIALQGTKVSVDVKDNAKVYGEVQALSLLTTDGNDSPAAVTPYMNALMAFVP